MKTIEPTVARTPHQIGRAAYLVAAAVLMATATPASAEPDFSGVWRLATDFRPELKTADGKTPPLLPSAQLLYRQRTAKYRAGDHSFDNASTICVSPGMPRMAFLPYPFEIIRGSKQIAFLFTWNGRHRIVDMSGGPLEVPDLFYMGSAAGRMEGDTLVIETRGLVDSSILDASGMPHSDQLRLVERYRLQDGGRALVDEMTIEDPKTFSRAWTARATYTRLPAGTETQEDVCRERVPKGGPAFEYDKWK